MYGANMETIPDTVMDTVQTGEPRTNVPACLNQKSAKGSQRLALSISTEKKSGVVFLKVEEIKPA